MPLAVDTELLKRNPTKKLTVGVAIDGSALSDKTLQAACNLIQQQRGDRLVILHVSDSSKKYLPRHLQPKHLENTYTSKAFDLRVGESAHNERAYQGPNQTASRCHLGSASTAVLPSLTMHQQAQPPSVHGWPYEPKLDDMGIIYSSSNPISALSSHCMHKLVRMCTCAPFGLHTCRRMVLYQWCT